MKGAETIYLDQITVGDCEDLYIYKDITVSINDGHIVAIGEE